MGEVNEFQLLEYYLDAILTSDDPNEARRNLALFEKQILVCESLQIDFNKSWCDATVYVEKARIEMNESGYTSKSIKDAIKLMNTAIDIYPDDVDYWYLRATLHMAVRNYDEVIRDTSYVIANSDDDDIDVILQARKLRDEAELMMGI